MENDKPKCKLIGTDGNAYNLIGRTMDALKEVGQTEKAEEFKEKAFKQESYDKLLQLIMEYVEVI